jgi:hypothetical protein
MPSVAEAIDAAIHESTRARSLVLRSKGKQVGGMETVAALKATALAWFNSHRPVITATALDINLAGADTHYATIMNATATAASRRTYLVALKDAKQALIALRTALLTAPNTRNLSSADDMPPDFSPLAANQEMRDILTRRWHECRKCVYAEANLAAIVMMGGLLEALFVSRANRMPNKQLLVRAALAPKDKKTGKTLNYQDWTLDAYIRVAHELQWISESAKDVADVLKEYRNYVHPEKERRHGVVLAFNDSLMFWQVTKVLVKQLLMSASGP